MTNNETKPSSAPRGQRGSARRGQGAAASTHLKAYLLSRDLLRRIQRAVADSGPTGASSRVP